ncbi:MAG: methyltransferase domain-containing protein [Nanoarchaeota archaeon]|nr:methyltransferase domain-containing protein [Nanoarchaeota archaeon]
MNDQDYIEKNRLSYNEMAPFYKIRGEKRDFKIYQDIIKFSDLVKKNFSNPSILEIGPGAGVILNYFSQRGFNTRAIDLSEEMIKVAQEMSPRTKYFLGNFINYDFDNMKFEGIFAKAILHLFSKEDATLFIKKSHEMLVKNGLFYLSVFLRNASKEGFVAKNMEGGKFVRYSKDWTESELECLLNHSQFRVIHTTNIPYGTMKKWSGILRK